MLNSYKFQFLTSKFLTSKKLFSIFNFQNRNLNLLLLKTASLYSINFFFNFLAIKNHEKGLQHRALLQWLKDSAKAKIKKDPYPLTILSTAPGYTPEPINEDTITARMLRTLYQETKLNIPFRRHVDVVNMQKLNGLNLGYHHFSTYKQISAW